MIGGHGYFLGTKTDIDLTWDYIKASIAIIKGFLADGTRFGDSIVEIGSFTRENQNDVQILV